MIRRISRSSVYTRGVESTQRVIRLDDGATTTIEEWGRAGPIMLCVHGMTSSRRSWLRFAQRYAGRYRVVAYDQRGHGDSADVAGPMTIERGVRDLENVAAQTGADVLIGHSWGGTIVIRGAHRTAAGSVVAIDPAIVQLDDRWYREFLDDIAAILALQGDARAATLRDAYAAWHEDDVAGKIHAMQAMSAAPIAALRDENRDGAWDLRADVAAFERRLLLLMAAPGESVVPPMVMNELRAHRGAQTAIVTFAEQGHNLHRTDFDGVAAEVDEFLAAR